MGCICSEKHVHAFGLLISHIHICPLSKIINNKTTKLCDWPNATLCKKDKSWLWINSTIYRDCPMWTPYVQWAWKTMFRSISRRGELRQPTSLRGKYLTKLILFRVSDPRLVLISSAVARRWATATTMSTMWSTKCATSTKPAILCTIALPVS